MTDEKLTETVEQARDRLMPQVLAYARMEGLSEAGIASAALRIGITDARAVFEKAYTPTDDYPDAEGLAALRAQDDCWPDVIVGPGGVRYDPSSGDRKDAS